jgi:hypothetical protein
MREESWDDELEMEAKRDDFQTKGDELAAPSS